MSGRASTSAKRQPSPRGPPRLWPSAKVLPSRRSGSAATDRSCSSWRRGSAAATRRSCARRRSESTCTGSRSQPRSARRSRRNGCGRSTVPAAPASASSRATVRPTVSGGRRRRPVSRGLGSTAAPSAPARCSRSAQAATRLSSGRRERPSAYASARPMPTLSSRQKRLLRLVATLVVTGLCTAYVVWKIDISRTAHLLAHASVGYFLGAVAIMVISVWPMAWRWQKLLEARGIRDRLPWLVRAYFVAYTAGQILPTAVGGDAVRIYETAKRHSGRGGQVAGSGALERALGGGRGRNPGPGGLRLAPRPDHIG